MEPAVLYATNEGVATLTLNRPQVMNAFNAALNVQLYEALAQAVADDEVRAVVITGAGRGFCVGQDLADLTSTDESVAAASLGDLVRDRYNALIGKLHAMPVPVLAAINGACAGAGLGLALACDLRFAADSAKFTTAFSRIGLVPDSGTSYFLPRAIGVAKAVEWAWSGEVIDGITAQAWGLVQHVYPADQLATVVQAYARNLAQGPTLAYRWTKQAMYDNANATLAVALEREAQLQEMASQTEDFRDGVKAFLEKRKTRFRGR
ncbi:2-(1,2-epoxy-1,2-dihydrophenyl)acetyl-CoA isomerase [Alicyclobacillaceae bacterium I2511]|nr:2-(1,2-epoxy-1,2-dihydrophenyl)acetyl-CoA isomerase [Alicyclobacillaceae bacterium I2511]